MKSKYTTRSNMRFASSPTHWLGLCTITFSALTAAKLQAVTYYWDGNDSTTGFGTATGTWAAPTTGTLTSGWSTVAVGTAVVNGNSITTTTADNLNFGTSALLAAGNITVSGTVDAGNIAFGASSSTTLLGGTINLAANSTLTTNTNNTSQRIESLITGAGTALNKAGLGTVILANAGNTFAGGINISGGILQFSSISALGSGTTLTMGVGTQNSNAPSIFYTGNVGATLTRDITLASGNGQTNFSVNGSVGNGNPNGYLIVNGNLSILTGNRTINFFGGGRSTLNNFQSTITNSSNGNTSVSVAGFTMMTLSGNNTYTGATSIGNGNLNVSNLSDTGSSSLGLGNRVNLGVTTTNGTLNYTGSGDTTARTFQIGGGTGNGDTGSGTISNNGSGALVFSAANFNVQENTGAGANAPNISRSLNLGGTNSGNNSINGIIQDNLGTETPLITVTKNDAGTWILGGANTYGGNTSITAGRLIVNGSTAAASSFAVSALATLGGSGTISGSIALSGSLAPGGAGVDIKTLSAGTTTWNGTATNLWNFDLSTTTSSSDRLAITGDLVKGSGSVFRFNFLGVAPTVPGQVHTLATWTGTTTFTNASEFSFQGLTGANNSGTFILNANSLQFSVIPEPSSALAGLLLTAGLLRCRRN